MIDIFFKICKQYGIYSIILFLVFMSPVFTYFILYQPEFIPNYNNYYVELLAIPIFSSCLFIIIYFFSLSISANFIKKFGKKVLDDIKKNANGNTTYEVEQNINKARNDYLITTNLQTTSIFMSFLTFVIILYYNTTYKVEFHDGLIIPLHIIGVYIFYSIACYIRFFNNDNK